MGPAVRTTEDHLTPALAFGGIRSQAEAGTLTGTGLLRCIPEGLPVVGQSRAVTPSLKGDGIG